VTEPENAQVAAVAALDEPTRRRLYDHVVRQAGPVSRDEAAAAVDLPRSTAAFHLDRLAEEGLLEVVYARRTGRSGPGAGRPSTLYRRTDREVVVSLPGRRYDLAGDLLAGALDEAESSGSSPRRVLERQAHEHGRRLGADARAAAGDAVEAPQVVVGVLEQHGFEPRAESGVLVLGNCPFHALAQQHTALVCGMNLQLVDGILDGLAEGRTATPDPAEGQPAGRGPAARARLDPAPGRCCVVLDGDWSGAGLP